MARIEALLAARLFVSPEIAGDDIYFASNMSGHISLYRMALSGSVPQPLLPPHIALQNPTLMEGKLFALFPALGQILVMIDNDGDENYQPMLVPMDGGFPEPVFEEILANQRVHLLHVIPDEAVVYFWSESRAFRANLKNREIELLGESRYGSFPAGHNESHSKVILTDAYGAGDHVLYLKEDGEPERKLLFGVPLEQREAGQDVRANQLGRCFFVDEDRSLLVTTILFSDRRGLALLPLDNPDAIHPVKILGKVHEGLGELEDLEHLEDERYLVTYNIDGCSWLYEGRFDRAAKTMRLEHVIAGRAPLDAGVLKGYAYDKEGDRFALSFTTATMPTQLFTVSGPERNRIEQHTRERVLGIPESTLAPGEDASFTSYDGLRISARLYLPDESLAFEAPYPLVYYVHGGPQSQEHPDFGWFSMPLIQFLTLNGFAVFVPNVRGSTGYGHAYMSHVVRDWGGADRLDHVHALTQVLARDPRLDTRRAAVVGRSYGGYMTLTLAARHPELWSAAVDMFGPYSLNTFADRVPESWKPFMRFLVGDPATEADFLAERSPRTYMHQIQAPLLVIQGANDPRVWEQESRELVEELRHRGKDVEYLMFPDEGHDVLKYENRVRCYNAITDFFKAHLQPRKREEREPAREPAPTP